MEVKNEIRRDSIEGRFVIIAPGRGARPHGGLAVSKPLEHGRGACRLCPELIDKEKSVLEIPDPRDKTAWQTKVVVNAFPIVDRGYPGAYGSHELVIETPRRDRAFHEFGPEEVSRVFGVYAARIAALGRDRLLKYATVFRNEGRMAGASLAHPHSQIVAGALPPPDLIGRNSRIKAAFRKTGVCPYCALLEREAKGERLVGAAKSAIALAPHASLFPYEVWLLPKAHRHSLAGTTARERKDLAELLLSVAKFLAGKNLDWNLVVDELFGARETHLAIRIFPRGTVWAAVELATGMITNPVSPELAAIEYRNKIR
jgi:UDPglucose--hexose-1-phosphate uridylyltransferase